MELSFLFLPRSLEITSELAESGELEEEELTRPASSTGSPFTLSTLSPLLWISGVSDLLDLPGLRGLAQWGLEWKYSSLVLSSTASRAD